MNDRSLVHRWNRASGLYDWTTSGEHRRLVPHKQALFSRARGRLLLVGAGTGRDFELLPEGVEVEAIDVSPLMVERARERASRLSASIRVDQMDVREMAFADDWFDTVIAVCVFCSVPRPAAGLREVRRVLRPGGRLLMIEHVRSRLGPVAMMQDLMSVITRRFGPEMNRDTLQTVLRCGFRLVREENLYLDIVKAIIAE